MPTYFLLTMQICGHPEGGSKALAVNGEKLVVNEIWSDVVNWEK
jgi:hypothetical protein